MRWHFPLFKKRLSKLDQLQKVEIEVQEVRDNQLGQFHECVEALDVVHAAETYLRHNFSKDMIKGAKKYVIQKNQARGYYR